MQLYNIFPGLANWIKNRQVLLNHVAKNVGDIKDLIRHLKETLNPEVCRGYVDCFLLRKQKEVVGVYLLIQVINKFLLFFLNTCISIYAQLVFQDSGVSDSLYNEKNLLFSVTNLFGAGTDTTAATLRWGLLLMAKYPQIQGDENRSSR